MLASLVFAAVALADTHADSMAAPIVAAENQFAADAQRYGTRLAFLAHFDAGSWLFRPYPTAAHGLMRLECDGGVTAVGGYHTLGPPVATDDALYFAGQNYLTYVIGLYKYDGTSMSLVKSTGSSGAPNAACVCSR